MTLTVEAERNRALLDWYHANGRQLPWRGTRDPYAVMVSEIMLQQTQADRVVPYYRRFLRRFPDAAALAAAPFAEVAQLWTGLGYNMRAKRLHEAAKQIAVQGWPDSIDGLCELPGIGRYTANAIAAFARHEHVPAVDTNLRRVLTRWHGESLDGRKLDPAAQVALADADAADWNQAMMDLGATRCRPRSPRCGECPVAPWCAGPDTYQPPRPQPRFEGSMRQVRGAIVRHLCNGASDFPGIVAIAGAEPAYVAETLDALIDDGMLVATQNGYELSD